MNTDKQQPSFFEMDNQIVGKFNGLPYEGPPLNLKNDDGEAMQPRLKGSCMAKVFRMDDPNDIQEYNKVVQKMADGHAMQSIQQVNYNEARGTFDIFLRWMEFKYIAPEGMTNGKNS